MDFRGFDAACLGDLGARHPCKIPFLCTCSLLSEQTLYASIQFNKCLVDTTIPAESSPPCYLRPSVVLFDSPAIVFHAPQRIGLRPVLAICHVTANSDDAERAERSPYFKSICHFILS
jgi:hypothetical protein